MKNLLEKLDRKAANWLNAMDTQVQQPVVQVLTGEVFTHGTASSVATIPAAPVQMTTPQPEPTPVREAAPETARVSTRVLRTTNAVRQS